MKRNGLEKLKRVLGQMRVSPQKAADIQAVAKKLGRERSKRGKEPTWINSQFSTLRPLSIPDHGGKDLAVGTKNSILDQLDDDVLKWEDYLDEQEKA